MREMFNSAKLLKVMYK